MPVATITLVVAVSSGRSSVNASGVALPPPIHTDVKPARSILAAVAAGSAPIHEGGGIQIPRRPSRARSSSVMLTVISRGRGFIPQGSESG